MQKGGNEENDLLNEQFTDIYKYGFRCAFSMYFACQTCIAKCGLVLPVRVVVS